MNCPHCNKVIVIRISKDSTAGASAPSEASEGLEVGELLARIDPEAIEDAAWRQFIVQTSERFDKWGEKILMSEKQMKFLRMIADKA